ncbi:MAG: Gfo/Idh/MocA family oxidoreductase [Chloroflexi bacterium]|nr:Gfo/Idh/MocA family oxidoreductase [Chloroflexota bacterium]
MADTRLRSAVVGCRIGALHAAGYSACNDTRLVALCDKDSATLQQVGRDFGVQRLYTDFDVMLRSERLDLLTIATAQPLHAEMTIRAAEYHPQAILCEKPMASSMGEARAMLDACNQNGVRLAIGHEWRWMDLHVKARSLIAEGAIGEPRFAYVSVDPGGLMNRGTHQINYTLYVLGDPKVEWVLANVQRETDRYERGWPAEDLAGAMIGLDNGVRIAVDSDVRPSVDDDESAQIVVGSEGLMLWPCDFSRVPFGLKLLRKQAAEFEVFPPGPDRGPEFIAHQIADLARWARGEIETHRGDANIAIQTQEILMGIYESARTHSLVRLPLKTQSSPLLDAIRGGDLEVRYPGRYDIRYREQLPV